MEVVKVEKTKLLEHLKKNRKRHLKEHKEAVAGWRTKCYDAAREEADRLERDEEPNLQIYTNLPKPQSFEKEYDNAIAMMEWERSDLIELEFAQFKQWVRDEWNWSPVFAASNRAYSG